MKTEFITYDELLNYVKLLEYFLLKMKIGIDTRKKIRVYNSDESKLDKYEYPLNFLKVYFKVGNGLVTEEVYDTKDLDTLNKWISWRVESLKELQTKHMKIEVVCLDGQKNTIYNWTDILNKLTHINVQICDWTKWDNIYCTSSELCFHYKIDKKIVTRCIVKLEYLDYEKYGLLQYKDRIEKFTHDIEDLTDEFDRFLMKIAVGKKDEI